MIVRGAGDAAPPSAQCGSWGRVAYAEGDKDVGHYEQDKGAILLMPDSLGTSARRSMGQADIQSAQNNCIHIIHISNAFQLPVQIKLGPVISTIVFLS